MDKFSADKVRQVAAMLTEDPDILVEYEGTGKAQALIAQLSGIKDPRQLQGLVQEYQSFVQYRPSLQQQGEEAAVKAFIQYKKTGKMPGNSDPASLDARGGEFGGGDGRLGKTGYY